MHLSKLPWIYLWYIVSLAAVSSCTGVSADTTESELIPGNILNARYSRELSDIQYESSEVRLARGKYLAEGLYCLTCHTEVDKTLPGWPPIMEKKFSGALRYQTDSTYLYAPNLTPDEETGIGRFTDDMLARAIREGVGHDGRALVPPGRMGMPWFALRNLTDEDLASIIVYLRSLPPIKNPLPSRNIGDAMERTIREISFPLSSERETLDLNDKVTRGKYLINLSECNGCHRSNLSGGIEIHPHNGEHVFSANISSDPTGIGGWTEEMFISTIRNGKGRSGEMDHRMPWVTFKNLSNEDLGAIYAALQTSYPLKHIVLNNLPLSECAVCKQKHGGGSANEPETIVGIESTPPVDLTGKYVNSGYGRDTLNIFYKDEQLYVMRTVNRNEFPLIAISDSSYLAEGFAAPIIVGKDETGKVRHVRFYAVSLFRFNKLNDN